jgi:hypothetical protein
MFHGLYDQQHADFSLNNYCYETPRQITRDKSTEYFLGLTIDLIRTIPNSYGTEPP